MYCVVAVSAGQSLFAWLVFGTDMRIYQQWWHLCRRRRAPPKELELETTSDSDHVTQPKSQLRQLNKEQLQLQQQEQQQQLRQASLAPRGSSLPSHRQSTPSGGSLVSVPPPIEAGARVIRGTRSIMTTARHVRNPLDSAGDRYRSELEGVVGAAPQRDGSSSGGGNATGGDAMAGARSEVAHSRPSEE